MPLAVDSLTPQSSREQIQKAISESVSQCMAEGGREQDQCVAMAHGIAKKKTGDGSPNRSIRAGLEKD